MSDKVLLDLLTTFHSARVLVFGDVMLDRFVYGSVERISPEAPIPVMNVERTVDMLGGAANVARNVAGLGGRAGVVASHAAGRPRGAEPSILRARRLPGRPPKPRWINYFRSRSRGETKSAQIERETIAQIHRRRCAESLA